MERFELPRWWAAFLAWLLDDEWEVALGDFQEYYQEIARDRGPTAARRAFRLQVLSMVPGRLSRKVSQSLLMGRNYLLLGARHLRKERVSSVINIFGLTVAVGCSVTVFLFLDGYLNMNRSHANGERIFVVEQVLDQDGERVIRGTSPTPIGPAVAADLPQIERMVRTTGRSASVRADDLAFEEWVTFVEPGFLDMFNFPMAAGPQNALATPDAVVLSHAAARRHFGDRDPIGETLNLVLGYERTISLTVSAIAERFPSNAGVVFTMLASFDRLNLDPGDWAGEVRATYLQTHAPSDRAAVEAHLVSYADRHRAAAPDLALEGYRLENLVEPSPNAWRTERRFSHATHPAFVWMMMAIPLFMLALACFNYINISLGAASRRLREIGVRKAMGSSRSQLVLQFLGENVVLCAIALGLGVVLAFTALIPLFNSIFVNQIVFRPADIVGLIGFLAFMLALVAVASGIYPAVYVSSFATVRILRGRLTVTGRIWLSKTLLTGQFVLAFLTVIASLYLTLNGRHIVSAEWGYDPSGTVVVRLDSGEQFQVMYDAAAQLADVEVVAGSRSQIGGASSRIDVEIGTDTGEIPSYHVGPDYLEAVGLEFASGRTFGRDFPGDVGRSIIVNRAFASRFLTDDPSAPVRFNDSEHTVVGVVEDFHVWFAVQDMPAMFTRSDESDHRYLTVRTRADSEARVLAALKASWDTAFPDIHFDGFRQAEVFDQQFQSYRNVVQAFSYLAALALLIACMGLFGLANQNAARRMKEVSIRKVLGASVPHIALLANRGFAVMLTIAAGIAALVTYVPFRLLLDSLDIQIVHLPLGPGVFLTAYLLVMITAALSVGVQARRLTTVAPANALRVD